MQLIVPRLTDECTCVMTTHARVPNRNAALLSASHSRTTCSRLPHSCCRKEALQILCLHWRRFLLPLTTSTAKTPCPSYRPAVGVEDWSRFNCYKLGFEVRHHPPQWDGLRIIAVGCFRYRGSL
jgi:hypothetical protein